MKGRYLSDLLDTLSYGAGEGFSDQITGLVNLLTTDPRNTLSNLYQGAKSIVQNPQAAYQAAKQGVTEAMSSPQAAAKFIGQNFSPVELANGLGNVGKMREIAVYHGTPHKFDAFDASKIGTGEGAQAYGHGIYVAENPEVAKGYQTRLTADRDTDSGSLLTVDLPDSHIDRMLDWDKPLSEQHPDVQKALYATGYTKKANQMTGKELYRDTAESLSGGPESENPNELASKLFAAHGIPGIKYLDQGSRKTGNGTRNFVVFPGEEHNLKILGRK